MTIVDEISASIATAIATIIGKPVEEVEPTVKGILWLIIIIFAVYTAVKIYRWLK